jgi:uncharacterized membrane-anchored protein
MFRALNSGGMAGQHDFHCVVTKRAVNINGTTYSTAQPISSLVPMLFAVEQLMPGIELAIDTINSSIAVGFPDEIILGAPQSRAGSTRSLRRPPGSMLPARRQGRSCALARRHVGGT